MTDKVHPMNNPPPYHAGLPDKKDPRRGAVGLLQNFFAGVLLECATRGFCVVNVKLIQGLFEAAVDKAEPVNLPALEAEALRYGLTAVLDRANARVVFRVWHPPDSSHAETMIRVHAEVTCDVCGFTMREHPRDLLFNWLRVRCDGRRVKL